MAGFRYLQRRMQCFHIQQRWRCSGRLWWSNNGDLDRHFVLHRSCHLHRSIHSCGCTRCSTYLSGQSNRSSLPNPGCHRCCLQRMAGFGDLLRWLQCRHLQQWWGGSQCLRWCQNRNLDRHFNMRTRRHLLSDIYRARCPGGGAQLSGQPNRSSLSNPGCPRCRLQCVAGFSDLLRWLQCRHLQQRRSCSRCLRWIENGNLDRHFFV
ncbi:MAG: hypothetical protein JPMHGGIA_00006 [Saprospiraceae bacterium]|nr:hypothetical protein [Saprospiraceae bacterium]